jgi:hypothetical protein
MTEEGRKLDSELVRGKRFRASLVGDFALVVLLCGCCCIAFDIFAKDSLYTTE